MTLPSSGPMTMTLIANEATLSTATKVNLGNRAVRNVARIFTNDTRIAYSNMYGKSRFTFQNGNFADGNLTPIAGGLALAIPGWIVYLKQIKLNGVDNILNFPSPADPTPFPPGSPGDNVPAYPQPGYTNYEYTASVENNLPPGSEFPTRSLRLVGLGITDSFGIVHGPYAVSSVSIGLEEGDEVSFWWKAEGSIDAYDIYAYLINTTTGSTIEIANDTGVNSSSLTPWTKVTKIITNQQASPDWRVPDYKFVFVSGSYDFSGGQFTGASLYFTQITVKKWFEFLA